MALGLTKRVRMDQATARLLSDLATQEGMTESQVLREGLRLFERVRLRRAHIEDLIALLPGPAPKRLRTAGR